MSVEYKVFNSCKWVMCGSIGDQNKIAKRLRKYGIDGVNVVSDTGINAFGENVRLGSDLLLPSSLDELGIKHETVSFYKF